MIVYNIKRYNGYIKYRTIRNSVIHGDPYIYSIIYKHMPRMQYLYNIKRLTPSAAALEIFATHNKDDLYDEELMHAITIYCQSTQVLATAVINVQNVQCFNYMKSYMLNFIIDRSIFNMHPNTAYEMPIFDFIVDNKLYHLDKRTSCKLIDTIILYISEGRYEYIRSFLLELDRIDLMNFIHRFSTMHWITDSKIYELFDSIGISITEIIYDFMPDTLELLKHVSTKYHIDKTLYYIPAFISYYINNRPDIAEYLWSDNEQLELYYTRWSTAVHPLDKYMINYLVSLQSKLPINIKYTYKAITNYIKTAPYVEYSVLKDISDNFIDLATKYYMARDYYDFLRDTDIYNAYKLLESSIGLDNYIGSNSVEKYIYFNYIYTHSDKLAKLYPLKINKIDYHRKNKYIQINISHILSSDNIDQNRIYWINIDTQYPVTDYIIELMAKYYITYHNEYTLVCWIQIFSTYGNKYIRLLQEIFKQIKNIDKGLKRSIIKSLINIHIRNQKCHPYK